MRRNRERVHAVVLRSKHDSSGRHANGQHFGGALAMPSRWVTVWMQATDHDESMGRRRLARQPRQDLNHQHAALLALRALVQRIAGEFFVAVSVVLLGRVGRLGRSRHAEEAAALIQFLLPIAVPQETVVANALESIR